MEYPLTLKVRKFAGNGDVLCALGYHPCPFVHITGKDKGFCSLFNKPLTYMETGNNDLCDRCEECKNEPPSNRIIDLDKLLGECPEDDNQEQAEYEAAMRHGSLPVERDVLPSQRSASELDKETHDNFIKGLEKIR